MHKPLPAQYAWLLKEPGPKMVLEFLKVVGTVEAPGNLDNPEILSWAKEAGIKGYTHDSIPWCGLHMGIIAFRAGKPLPKNPLWALDWAEWGQAKQHPELGDVLTFKRDGGGHVGMYIGEDDVAYHVGGGNQHDESCITRIAKARLYAARQPVYQAKPANVRRIYLAATGSLSRNEA